MHVTQIKHKLQVVNAARVSRTRSVNCGAAVVATLDLLSVRGHGPKRQQESDWLRHERDGGRELGGEVHPAVNVRSIFVWGRVASTAAKSQRLGDNQLLIMNSVGWQGSQLERPRHAEEKAA